jgi:hypothetical protein
MSLSLTAQQTLLFVAGLLLAATVTIVLRTHEMPSWLALRRAHGHALSAQPVGFAASDDGPEAPSTSAPANASAEAAPPTKSVADDAPPAAAPAPKQPAKSHKKKHAPRSARTR